MPTTRSVEERLADLRRRRDQLRVQEQTLVARAATRARKDDTRRKILLGAFLLAKLDRDHGLRDLLRRELPGFLHAAKASPAARERDVTLLADLLRDPADHDGDATAVAGPPGAAVPSGDDRRA